MKEVAGSFRLEVVNVIAGSLWASQPNCQFDSLGPLAFYCVLLLGTLLSAELPFLIFLVDACEGGGVDSVYADIAIISRRILG